MSSQSGFGHPSIEGWPLIAPTGKRIAHMRENIVQVADGSVVVFDKETREAYILQPHSISVTDSDEGAAAVKVLVENGKGIRIH